MSEQAAVTGEARSDLVALLAEPGSVTVAGIRCEVRRIQVRELLEMAKLISPALSAIADLQFDDADSAAPIIAGALLASFSLDPDGLLGFAKLLVRPIDPVDSEPLARELDNPSLDSLRAIVGVVVEQEAADVVGLMGKAQQVIEWAATLVASGHGPGGVPGSASGPNGPT